MKMLPEKAGPTRGEHIRWIEPCHVCGKPSVRYDWQTRTECDKHREAGWRAAAAASRFLAAFREGGDVIGAGIEYAEAELAGRRP